MKNREVSPLIRKIDGFCQSREFYKDGEKTLVGFSGGADSVCLIHALISLIGADRIIAVHINHMLRGADADGDEAFCRKFCADHGISFSAKKIDVAAMCGGTGFEKAARDVRYRTFEEEAERHGCRSVSLAHTASDNLETMLFHLCRGSGLSGLSGIPPARPLGQVIVVRPLLTCTRDEIIDYIRENGLSYRTDATNSDIRYTRNFIRHEIVPLLKQINPAAEANAMAAAFAAADAADLIHKEADIFLRDHPIQTEAPAELVASLPSALFYEVCQTMYRKAGGDTLSSVQAEAVHRLIKSGKKGRYIGLTGGIVAAIDGETFRLVPAKDFEKELDRADFSVRLHKGENRLPGGNCLYIGVMPPPDLADDARFSAHVRMPENALDVSFARSRRDGEAYRTGGMTRTLKKLLCGAPRAVKKNRPVICGRDGAPLWFPGAGVADGLADGPLTDIFYFEI